MTSGTIEEHLRPIGRISNAELLISAGWGSRNVQGKVHPGHGRTEERDWTQSEKTALRKGFAKIGIDESRGFELLGSAVDVYLNEDELLVWYPSISL